MNQNPKLVEVKAAITLADSTVLQGLAGLAGAAVNATHYSTTRDGRELHGWRLHLQLDLKTFCPCRAIVTGARA
jgi:hypothetical protein